MTNQKNQPFFDERTYTLTYVVYDEKTKDAVVIDPVLDYEPCASAVWTGSADKAADFVEEQDLNLHYILETHAHADYLSGARRIQERFPDAKIAIGAKITDVQELFKGVFNLRDEFPTDGRQFDVLLDAEGDAGVVHFAGAHRWNSHPPLVLGLRRSRAIII